MFSHAMCHLRLYTPAPWVRIPHVPQKRCSLGSVWFSLEPVGVLQSKHFRKACFECFALGFGCRAQLCSALPARVQNKKKVSDTQNSSVPPAIGSTGAVGVVILKGLLVPENDVGAALPPPSLSFRFWIKPSSTPQQTLPEMGGSQPAASWHQAGVGWHCGLCGTLCPRRVGGGHLVTSVQNHTGL